MKNHNLGVIKRHGGDGGQPSRVEFLLTLFISELSLQSAHLVERAVASTGQTAAALQAVLILAAGGVMGAGGSLQRYKRA